MSKKTSKRTRQSKKKRKQGSKKTRKQEIAYCVFRMPFFERKINLKALIPESLLTCTLVIDLFMSGMI